MCVCVFLHGTYIIGIVEYDKNVRKFICPVCNQTCCLKCHAKPYHNGFVSCDAYKEHCMKEIDRASEAEREILLKLMKQQGAHPCPHCGDIISREGGC